MIRIGFYSDPMNAEIKEYLGLYREAFSIDYMKCSSTLNNLINLFFEKSCSGQELDYNEENLTRSIELYNNLKKENWNGNLICFADNPKTKIPNFMMVGYDICADSMHYSPLGDGFLMQYNKSSDFYSDMFFDTYSNFKHNLNENGLFNSFETASAFSKYCNHINIQHRYCIESEDNWRPFEIHIYVEPR